MFCSETAATKQSEKSKTPSGRSRTEFFLSFYMSLCDAYRPQINSQIRFGEIFWPV